MTVPVSVIVMTKNEERNLGGCLASVREFDEVFVVDSGSTDFTVKIAQAHGAQVVPFTWNGGYPKKKQWCLENLPFSHSWVLYLDADEQVTPDLAQEIACAIDGTESGFFVGLDYVFLGRRLRFGSRVYKLILLRREFSRFAEHDDLGASNMWEVEGHYQPLVHGAVRTLRGRIVHQDHEDLFHYFERHNKYSDWEAVVGRTGGAIAGTRETARGHREALKSLRARLPFKGLTTFAYEYLLRLAILDGRAGFHYAVARGFYYWQVGLKSYEQRTR